MSDMVITLIAGDTARPRVGEAASAIHDALAEAGAEPGDPDWLAPSIACDIRFTGLALDAADHAAQEALVGLDGFDVVIQPTTNRQKRLLVADMESTVIANEMLVEMADRIGLGDKVAAVTRRAMNGEIDFAESLRERVALFRDQPESLLAEVARRVRYTPGAATLVATMKAHGARAVLVSGGFYAFANAVRDALGFDRDYANDLVIEDRRITGTVREPILDAHGKRAVLDHCMLELGIAPALALAVGDGANDLPMLEAAGLGVAYHAKSHVRARIRHRIDQNDLTALLYIQGYRAGELVRD